MDSRRDKGGRKMRELVHDMSLKGRKEMDITGVKHVESFDHQAFHLETMMGFLIIEGENLQMVNVDVDEGVVSLKGKINRFMYVSPEQKGKAKGVFSKLFR